MVGEPVRAAAMNIMFAMAKLPIIVTTTAVIGPP
jgi:hypothetical protein